MIVDTSVLLAVIFDEPGADRAVDELGRHAGELIMSTISLTEFLIHLRDRGPANRRDIERDLLDSGIRFVPPDVAQGRRAADARLRYPLNLGGCFVYALAAETGGAILTLDRDFRAVDVPVHLV